MRLPWPTVAGWYHAAFLAALPWAAWLQPRWAPLLFAGAVLVHGFVRRTRAVEPWTTAAVLVSAAGCTLAAVAWASPFVVAPGFVEPAGGGWLAPALVLLAARRLGGIGRAVGDCEPGPLGPPSREVRGTLSLRGVVAAENHLPSTSPIDLDLRAGESLAILCDDLGAAQTLADLLAGRRRTFDGEITIDGCPLEPSDRLVAVVAPGELFVAGSLAENLGVLRGESLDRGTLGAARDACGLAEADRALEGRPMAADGEPLEPFHRLLVLAGRVLVSHYRLVVAVDPGPWVDSRRTELWRSALVRSSVGRTSVWITNDVELADRAGRVLELVDGSLRPV